MTTTFILAQTADQKRQCLDIRTEVFVREQGYTIEQEVDEHDTHPLTLQFLLLSSGSQSTRALGALRIFPMPPLAVGEAYHGKTYRLGRIAVPKSERGKGYGRVMMEGIHEYLAALAKEREPVEVVLYSQVPKVGFYTKFGYTKQGDEFLEDGQPHLKLTRLIY